MSTQVQWSDADIEALISFLWDKRATAGDGMSFKLNIWNEAALKVSTVLDKKGGKKTYGSCKSKWAKVRGSLSVDISAHRAILHVVEGDLPHCGGYKGTIRIQMERRIGG